MFTSADDIDAATTGFQTDVVVTALDSNGSPAEIESAELALRVGGQGEFSIVGGTATLDGNKATFAAVSLAAGAIELRATVRQKGNDKPGTATIIVSLQTPRPAVTALSFVGDANTDKKLNRAELPTGSPQIRVVTTSSGRPDGTVVKVKASSPAGTVYGTGQTTGNIAVVTLQLPDTQEADYELAVELTDSAGISNKLTGPATAEDPINTQAFTPFRIDRVLPSLAYILPAEGVTAVGPNDDSDGNVLDAFFVLRLTLATSVDVTGASGVQIAQQGGSTRNFRPTDLTVTDDVTVPATGTVAYTFSATATDDSGNVTTLADRTITVDLEAPVVVITQPTAGAHNAGNQTIIVSVTGGEGLPVQFYSQLAGQPQSLLGSVTVASGQAQLSHSFQDGSYTLLARVTDAAGNVGSATVAPVVIDTVLCNLVVTKPLNATSVLNAGDDEGAGAGLQYTVTGSTSDCMGRTVTLLKDGVSQGTVVAHASTGVFTFPITLADGSAVVLRTEIADAAGNVTAITNNVSVDITAPVVAITQPTAGAYGVSSQTIRATVTGAEGRSVQFFAQLSGLPASLLGTATVSSGIAQLVFSFPDGSYTLSARVTDAAGNLGTASAGPVVIDTAGCNLVLVRPLNASNVLNMNDDEGPAAGLQYTVTGSTSDCKGRTVTVLKDGVSQGTAVADASTGAFAVAITLADGSSSTLRADISDVAGNLTSVSANVLIDITPPVLTITQPVPGAYNSSSQTIQVAVTGAESRTVSFYNQLSGLPESLLGTATVSSGAAQLTHSLPDGIHTLIARVSDAAGNVGAGTVGPVTIDTAGCNIVLTKPVDAVAVLAMADDEGAAAGLQYTVTGTTTDCRGRPVTLFKDGVSQATTTADASTGIFAFSITLADGAAALLRTDIVDIASNVTSASASVTVDITAPGVTITQPAAGTYNASSQTIGATVTGAEGRTVSFYSQLSGVPESLLGTATVSSGAAQITRALSDGSHTLIARVTDAAGNTGTGTVGPVVIDTAGCNLVVTKPLNATMALNATDDEGAGAGLQYTVTGSTDNCLGETVTLYKDDVSQGTTTAHATTGVFTFAITLADGSSQVLKVEMDDGSGNVVSVSRTVTVDISPPVVTLTQPAAGTYNVGSQTVQVTVTGGEGLTAQFYSQLSGQPESLVGTATVASGAAQLTSTYLDGSYTLTVRVTDAAGNVGSASVGPVVIDTVPCSLVLTNPANAVEVLNASDDENGAANLQFTVTGTTSDCQGRTVSLYMDDVLQGSAVSNVTTGAFGIFVTIADGSSAVLRVSMTDAAGNASSDSSSVTVDVTVPVISDPIPVQGALFYVADSNNHIVPTVFPGYYQDLVADGDAQADFGFTVTGAVGGTARLLYLGVVLRTVAVDTDPKVISMPSVTLTQATAGSLVMDVTDPAGNTTTRTTPTTVDVIPPANPSPAGVVPSGNCSGIPCERQATVRLSWDAGVSYDDAASAGSGAVTGYAVHWSTNARTATGIVTQADYDSAALSKNATASLVSGAATSYDLAGLPPLSTYWIQVRAEDDVGNLSRIGTQVQVDNYWTRQTFSHPSPDAGTPDGGDPGFAFDMASNGDLNGDSIDDLVTNFYYGANPSEGKAFVLYGNATMASANFQVFAPPGATAEPRRFGNDMSVGNADGVAPQDMLVGEPLTSSNQGRAYLYFGRTPTLLTAPDVEFRGAASAQIGRTVQIIGDISGDTLGEVYLSANGEASGQGRVYIWYGRTQADWATLMALGPGFVPVSTATCTAANLCRYFEGPLPTTSGGNYYGRSRQASWLGDITGDGRGDLALTSPGVKRNTAWFFSGAVIDAAVSPILVASAMQSIAQTAGTTSSLAGIGARTIGNVNLVGGAGKDVLMNYADINQILIYPDGNVSGFTASPVTISGYNNTFAYAVSVGDLSGDGMLDIVAGDGLNPAGVTILINKGIVGDEFDLLPAVSGFANSRIVTTTRLGVSLATGDFNGDGKLDLAAGDPKDGLGKVFIYH